MRTLSLTLVLFGLSCSTHPPGPAMMKQDGVVKYARFKTGNDVHYGILEGERLRVISGVPWEPYTKSDRLYPVADVRLLSARPAARVANLHREARRAHQVRPDDHEVAASTRSSECPQDADVTRFEDDDDRGLAEWRGRLHDPEFHGGAAEPPHRRPATQEWQPTLEPAEQVIALADVPLRPQGEPEHHEQDQSDRDRRTERLERGHVRTV